MKAIFRMVSYLALVVLLVAPVWAQQQGQQGPPQQGQQQGPPPTQPAQPPATPAVPAGPPLNPEEEADYKAFADAPRAETTRIVELGEAFLKKFPESRYRGLVYSRLASVFLDTAQIDKLYVVGEKALEINPDNVGVLAMIAFAVPKRLSEADLDAQQKLEKCELYGKKAIDLVTAMSKPENVTEEEFTKAKNETLSMAHSGLGMVNFHRQRFADMVTEFEEAIKVSATPDPADQFMLGYAYFQVKRYDDAAGAYGKCSEAMWAWQARCKASMAEAKKLAGQQPKAAKQP